MLEDYYKISQQQMESVQMLLTLAIVILLVVVLADSIFPPE